MRAGGYTVHQSLTAEAASVLKLSLDLARRRGHAQITPLHVAYTLLGCVSTSPSPSPHYAAAASSTPAYGLLRRACARSSHPAQCRALELCFNVALNRLPAAVACSPLSSPSSSSSSSTASSASLAAAASFLHHLPCPTLSNALVAALKRAQASQRRGCVELQTTQQTPSPPPTSTSQQQQQLPLLMIRVELDQLIVSILDDPSVSRVMREAGFSSAAVKACLDDDNATLVASAYGGGASWPSAPFLSYLYQQPDVELESACEDDVRAILEVMTQGRRSNPVAVADTASAAEASAAAAMTRLERDGGGCGVPGELRGARVLRLHLSRAHVRLMTRADVDACVADLRRAAAAAAADTTGGLVIYVGEMSWAVDDDGGEGDADGFSPAARLAAELARLLDELRATPRAGRAWLVAAASYGTYMRWQRTSSSLEATWALQPVPVPAAAGGGGGGGLGLGLALGPRAATRETDGKVVQLAQFPLLDFSSPKEEDGVPFLCVECTRNYDIEASAVIAKAQGTNLALTFFPGWPQADEPQTSHKDDLMDMKRKWSELCRRVHLQTNQATRQANATTSPGLSLSFGTSEIKHQDVKTTLSLLPLDSAATSDEVRCHRNEDMDAKQATAQESDRIVDSTNMKNVLRLWIDELPKSDLKRKVENVRPLSESKRWRGGCGLDLNLCADDVEVDPENNGSASSEDELIPSDFTNDGGASGDVSVTNSLESHR
ncbi:unnamed protein product [Urochloa humidicola]